MTVKVIHHISNPFPLDPMFYGQNFVIGDHARNSKFKSVVASSSPENKDGAFFDLQRRVAFQRFFTKLVYGNFHQVFTEFSSEDSFAPDGFNSEYKRVLREGFTDGKLALAFHYFRDRYSGFSDLKKSIFGKQASLFIHLHSMADVYFKGLKDCIDAHTQKRKELLKRAIQESRPFFIAVSDHVKESFLQYDFIPEDRIEVVRNGVSTELYKIASETEKQDVRRKLGINGGKLVGYVGRISPEKGSAVLLSTLRYFDKTKDDLGFVIATSDGKDLERFVDDAQRGAGRLIAEGRLKLCVDVSKLIAGPYSQDKEVVAFFAERAAKKVPREMFGGVLVNPVQPALDVYIQPSQTEGISLSILEALMSGVPVVASNIGGIPEAVNYNNGTLIDIVGRKGLDVRDDFVDSIRHWTRNPQASAYVRSARANLISAGFSAQTMAEKLDKVYQEQ